MKRKNRLLGFILIGIGGYFLIQQIHTPFIDHYVTWPTLFIIIGVILIIHSYINRDYDKLFPGTVSIGLGIHFYTLTIYPNWIDHWGMYALIVGIAFLVRYQKVKVGLYPGIILILLGLFMILPIINPVLFNSIHQLLQSFEDYWPVFLIAFGFYLLLKKR